MKIVVTGGSGFVGQCLVPLLTRPGVQLLLVGRHPEQLSKLFPSIETCSYTDLENRAQGWDRLIHLAVVNTNSTALVGEYIRVNVDFMIEVAVMAQRAGIRQFINVSSIHALDLDNQSSYAVSKRQAVNRLAAINSLNSVTMYLPIVYADRWAGRLAWLNRLPIHLARSLFGLMAAFKPAVHVRRLAEFVLSEKHSQSDFQDDMRDGVHRQLILTDGQGTNRCYSTLKRIIDVTVALGVLLLFWWALFLLWVVIRIDSPGPGLFAQNRIGKGGREFVSYKFRTMKTGTPEAGTHEVSASAVTSVGGFLRRKKLDELPQIWNIIRNEMSLIGPRPCLPGQTELIKAREKLGVLKVIPGISGLAQINDIDMSNPRRLASWDARYVALRTLLLDAKIALSTIMGKGQGDKVKK